MTIIVNGEKIEDSDIQQEIERLRPEYEKAFVDMDPKEREAQLFEWSKENLIERVLFKQELKNTKLEITNERLDDILAKLKSEYEDTQDFYQEYNVENDEQVKEHIELAAKMRLKLKQLNKDLAQPSKYAIQQYYQENKESFQAAERVRVAHIVKYVNWQTDEETAYREICAAHDELRNGTPFEIVVDKYTDCSDSGGDLGYVYRGQMVEEFEDIIFNLAIGQVSGIFRSRYGFHIAKVYEKKPPAIDDFRRVKTLIADILVKQKQDDAFYDFIDQLRSKAKIEEI